MKCNCLDSRRFLLLCQTESNDSTVPLSVLSIDHAAQLPVKSMVRKNASSGRIVISFSLGRTVKKKEKYEVTTE